MSHAHDGTLTAEGLDVRIAGTPIVHHLDLHAENGRRVGLCGPNGSGKSTLLRAIFGALKPQAGRIWVGGDNTADLSRREIAHRIGIVLQERPGDFDFTVHDVVTMGRTAHHRLFDGLAAYHSQLVDEAIGRVGLDSMRYRGFNTLSGGEKQRALIARCIAQETSLLMLDEPTNHLDIRYQLEILDLVDSLNTTAIMAIHDLNLAAAYCDEIYLINHGHLVAHGPVETVLTPEAIGDVFGVNAVMRTHPVTGRPEFSFTRLNQPDHDRTNEMETI